MKHKWAKEAIAFFSGETIQYREKDEKDSCFRDWIRRRAPDFDCKNLEFQVKPKKEVVMYKWAVKVNGNWMESRFFSAYEERFIELTGICSEYPKKRLDYTATSFPVEGE